MARKLSGIVIYVGGLASQLHWKEGWIAFTKIEITQSHKSKFDTDE
jgi:hypothetical protein